MKNIEFLQNFPQITDLNLEHNEIQDFTTLKTFEKLVKLNVKHNLLKDFTKMPMEYLKSLKELDFTGNPCENHLSVMQNFYSEDKQFIKNENLAVYLSKSASVIHQQLQVELSEQDVNFQFFNQFVTQISLSRCKLLNIDKSSQFKDLTVLKLLRCNLTKFQLNYSPSLSELDLSFNKLSSLKFMENAPNCTKLSISNNKLREVDELYHLKYSKLEFLDIDRNPMISAKSFSQKIGYVLNGKQIKVFGTEKVFACE